METPLWYRVKTHELSFDDYLQAGGNENMVERYLIYFFSCLFQHDKYVSSSSGSFHIIQLILNMKRNQAGISFQISSTTLPIYLYILFYGSYFTDPVSIQIPDQFVGPQQLTLGSYFTEEYLRNWLNLLLGGLFEIGPVVPPGHPMNSVTPLLCETSDELQSNGVTELICGIKRACEYLIFTETNGLMIKSKSVPLLNSLKSVHDQIVETIQFFRGTGSLPTCLVPYRSDKRFFRSIVRQFWPGILKPLLPFSTEEEEVIRSEHDLLYKTGEITFLFHYIKEFTKVFGLEAGLTRELRERIAPSPKNDSLFLLNELGHRSPRERAELFLAPFPITDASLKSIAEEVKTKGFEAVLGEYINMYRTKLKKDFEHQNYELINEEFISNSESIYLTCYRDLLFHFVDQEGSKTKVYAFRPEEILEFSDTGSQRFNPFTREPLPDDVFSMAKQKKRSRSIPEIWSRLLRREIILGLN